MAVPPPPPPAPVSTRAIRPKKGCACCSLYTICVFSVLEFFGWWFWCIYDRWLATPAAFCFFVCIIGIISVAWFHKIMNLVALFARVLALLLPCTAIVLLSLYYAKIIGDNPKKPLETGDKIFIGVFMGIYGGLIFSVNSLHIICHAYLASWIAKGCPGATPPAPPVMAATPVVVAQPMY